MTTFTPGNIYNVSVTVWKMSVYKLVKKERLVFRSHYEIFTWWLGEHTIRSTVGYKDVFYMYVKMETQNLRNFVTSPFEQKGKSKTGGKKRKREREKVSSRRKKRRTIMSYTDFFDFYNILWKNFVQVRNETFSF